MKKMNEKMRGIRRKREEDKRFVVWLFNLFSCFLSLILCVCVCVCTWFKEQIDAHYFFKFFMLTWGHAHWFFERGGVWERERVQSISVREKRRSVASCICLDWLMPNCQSNPNSFGSRINTLPNWTAPPRAVFSNLYKRLYDH